MKVLMFGWEFPPYSSGGLGTACYGLTKGLSNNSIEVAFVVPTKYDAKADFVKVIPMRGGVLKMLKVDSNLMPYMTSKEYESELLLGKGGKGSSIYGKNIFEEVYRYSQKASLIAEQEPHDIIHCHDWMTFRAGINAKNVSHKPLVIHVHATEFDRTGNTGVNQHVYDIEREGMHKADAIIAVSQFTKNKIVEHYDVNPDKVYVVHNAVEFNDYASAREEFGIKENSKVVLFLGRITIQKGPDYFLDAAKKVLDVEPNVKFIVAGTGDMSGQMIERAAELGIADKVLFAGFLKGKDIDRAYKMADLYVMPSVSEPFGITPLEAMRNETPVIISKQSGVSEVISSCLKVDFWDTDKLANQILGVLRYQEVHGLLKENGFNEVKKMSWNDSARKCIEVYNTVLEAA
ncbi:MAG: glycosyltransferase family 4 protein [Nanoarchaeota archaeon]|nr:glycosyltransferase family 4 protein [Nanoarchaeota archaeon]